MALRLDPFVSLGDVAFDLTPAALRARRGPPPREARSSIGLTEHDYGDAVLRFQDNGRLEEITMQAPVLSLGVVAIAFACLGPFVRAHDAGAFERAGFLVSPGFGLAFVPAQPCWVTALAPHCLDAWRALPQG